MLEFLHLIKKNSEVCSRSISNEFGRLMQGVGLHMAHGSNTMEFMHRSKKPKTKTITYARIVCDHLPRKTEKNRTRLTDGSDRLTCNHATSIVVADLTLIKFFLNSILSTKNAKSFSVDIKDFILANNPLISPK